MNPTDHGSPGVRTLMHHHHSDAQHPVSGLGEIDTKRRAGGIHGGSQVVLTLNPGELMAMITKAVAEALNG